MFYFNGLVLNICEHTTSWRHNPLHASGENNLQICHGINEIPKHISLIVICFGISLEFHHYDEIP